VPESGSIRSSSLKSTGLPLAPSFAARFLVASMSACADDGMPQRAVASSRPSGPVGTIVSLSETQSCWQLISNRAMLLPYAKGL
jgi:hypothetical protein